MSNDLSIGYIPASRFTVASGQAVPADNRKMPPPPAPLSEGPKRVSSVEKTPALERIEIGLIGLGLVVCAVASNKVFRQDQDVPINNDLSVVPALIISGGMGLLGSVVGISAMEGLRTKKIEGSSALQVDSYLNSTRPATWLERVGYVSLGAALIGAGILVDKKYPSHGVITASSLIPGTLEIAGGTVLFNVAIGNFRVLKK